VAKAKRPPQTKKKLGGPRIGEGGPRQAKATAVADVQERLQGSSAVVLTEYRGMTVHELAELRRSLREAGADYKVYKNTLAMIAARNAGLDDLATALEGPTAFAFTQGDPVIVAKRLADFAKKVPALVLKAGVLDGRILNSGEVGALSALDSREVMLAKAAGMFLSPIQRLANLLAAPLNQLGSLLAQLRDKMPGEQPSPEAAPAAPDAAPTEAASAESAPTEASATPAEAASAESAPTEASATPAESAPTEAASAESAATPGEAEAAAPEVTEAVPAASAGAEEGARPVEALQEEPAAEEPAAEEPAAEEPAAEEPAAEEPAAEEPAAEEPAAEAPAAEEPAAEAPAAETPAAETTEGQNETATDDQSS
jgi:large subunit ribosomal protein L10